MRIIAGSAKGSRIFAPKGQDTRPTQDRVRESLFNRIQGDVSDAVVLDLFSGSGALALEALSRGAQKAVMVDAATEAADCIRRNVEKLGFEARGQLLKCQWEAAVSRLCGQGIAFDLVFIDPPYHMTDTRGIMESLARAGILAEGALLVVEHRKGAQPAAHPLFEQRSMRAYGDTEVSIWQYDPLPEQNAEE